MTTDTEPFQEGNDRDFGLPQVDFEPSADDGGKWIRLTAIIASVVLLLGAGGAYWFFFRPPLAEVPAACLAHEEVEEEEETAPPTQEADEGPAGLGLMEEEEGFDDPPAAAPAKGSITKINTPRGCYHVVAGSFIDGDLAADYAAQLAKQGAHVTLIAPPQGQYFFRVAVAQAATFCQANEEVAALKATYGPDIWVKKY